MYLAPAPFLFALKRQTRCKNVGIIITNKKAGLLRPIN
jgi:hypothetical protein